MGGNRHRNSKHKRIGLPFTCVGVREACVQYVFLLSFIFIIFFISFMISKKKMI